MRRDDPPAPAAAPVPHAGQVDAWNFDAAPTPRGAPGGDGTRFRREVFERGGGDAFAPTRHLPGLRMRDRSLGGRLQVEARRRACADLRGALSSRPESTAAIMASMQRWGCDA